MLVCFHLFLNLFVLFFVRVMVLVTADAVLSETATALLTVNATEKWNITVSCKSKQPLAACNFKFWYQDTSGSKNGPTIDLSSLKVANDSISGKNVGSVTSYSALKNDSKSCSISLNLSSGEYLMGCRTRTKITAWEYNFTTLHVEGHGEIHSAGYVVDRILPTSNFTIALGYKYNWTQCTFLFLGNLSATSTKDADDCSSTKTTHRYCFKGMGCNLTLLNVIQEQIAGPVFRHGRAKFNGSSNLIDVVLAAKLIVVEDKPSQHRMTVAYLPNRTWFHEDDILRAKCDVIIINSTSTSIRWQIGDQELSKNDVKDSSPWTWPWELRVIKQIASHRLIASDDGKNISCFVTHFYQNCRIDFQTTLQLEVRSDWNENRIGTIVTTISILLLAGIMGAAAAVLIFYSRRKEKIFSFVPRILPPERSSILVDNDLYGDHFSLESGIVDIPLVLIGNSQINQGTSRNSFIYSSIGCDYEVVDDEQKTDKAAEYNIYDEPLKVVTGETRTEPEEAIRNINNDPSTGINRSSVSKVLRESVVYEEILNSPNTIPFLPEANSASVKLTQSS